ncbi:iron-sulfur cluster assembly protein, partial [Pseudorhodoplanes sp.]|uniref:iron-sulfur cluster assembly protein n=1 Tax=Pseudorhodoplanes sp. TaxID=1934341 RepID=UPI00391DD5CC
MAPTKEQIRERLAQIAGPGGKALTDTGALSDIVVSDGKVFFSLSVDAAEVKAWEPVRKAVEDAVKALPGVTSAMVALTAERAAGRGAAPPQAAGRQKGGSGGGGSEGEDDEGGAARGE